MRIHCIGPGSIGSLVCFHLRAVSPVTLLLRSRQVQHRRSPPTLSIQLEHEQRTRTATGFDYEFLGQQQQQPIESLLVTTKAHHVLESLRLIRHRLSAQSTVVLLHNGLGVLEELIDDCFPDVLSRPSFVLATTSHGAYRVDRGTVAASEGSHGRFCHAGVGDIRLGVLPNAAVTGCLEQLVAQGNPGLTVDKDSPLTDQPAAQTLSHAHNPILNPLLDIEPSLDEHLPHVYPETRSLHQTLASLLHPSMVASLNTKWLSMSAFQTSALIKLAVNASINPVTALLETCNGALHDRSAFRVLTHQVCAEASAVFAAQVGRPLKPHDALSAASLERVVGDIIFATRANISSMCADMRALATSRLSSPNTLSRANRTRIGSSKPPLKKSTEAQDGNHKHRATEVDYINGYLCRLGVRYGVDTRANETLLSLVKLKADAVRVGQVLPRLRRTNRRMIGRREQRGAAADRAARSGDGEEDRRD